MGIQSACIENATDYICQCAFDCKDCPAGKRCQFVCAPDACYTSEFTTYGNSELLVTCTGEDSCTEAEIYCGIGDDCRVECQHPNACNLVALFEETGASVSCSDNGNNACVGVAAYTFDGPLYPFTRTPTMAPSDSTQNPTLFPTLSPSMQPTMNPTKQTNNPTRRPTLDFAINTPNPTYGNEAGVIAAYTTEESDVTVSSGNKSTDRSTDNA